MREVVLLVGIFATFAIFAQVACLALRWVWLHKKQILMENILMVDLKGQYIKIKDEIDAAISEVTSSCRFINGSQVQLFARELEAYTGAKHVIPCGNGTDALQIALMSLLKPGDEVIVPAFTYVATAEVIGLLGMVPVMVDVSYDTFNIGGSCGEHLLNAEQMLERVLTPRTKAIVPVHLFGQCADMELIMNFANRHGLYVIEDTAQAIGAEYRFSNGTVKQAGTIGNIGCTSFFPSKNLGCYGDGGALFTDDDLLAEKIRMIANHGQRVKYHHAVIGCNSRLDTIQAAVLRVKLKYLKEYTASRQKAAAVYDRLLASLQPAVVLPARNSQSTHVFHQYTIKVPGMTRDGAGAAVSVRDALKEYLSGRGVPSMIYYPLSLDEQEAFKAIAVNPVELNISKELSETVLSLPMHTELTASVQEYIVSCCREFIEKLC